MVKKNCVVSLVFWFITSHLQANLVELINVTINVSLMSHDQMNYL